MIFGCEAIIFDLDGVLVDSTAVVEESWRAWAVGRGLDPAAVLAVAHGRRTVDTIRMIAPYLDAAVEAEQLEKNETELSDGMVVIEGAPGLLASLPPGGWAIVTSGAYHTATARLAAGGLPIPAVLVTGSDVQRGKPDPQGYLLAGARLGVVPNTCLVIEDSPAGIAAAKAAGMRAIGITTTHVAEELSLADAIIGGLGELVISTSRVEMENTIYSDTVGAGFAQLIVEIRRNS